LGYSRSEDSGEAARANATRCCASGRRRDRRRTSARPPAQWSVTAPPDPRSLREDIDTDLAFPPSSCWPASAS
jgi:hypothetical protein